MTLTTEMKFNIESKQWFGKYLGGKIYQLLASTEISDKWPPKKYSFVFVLI